MKGEAGELTDRQQQGGQMWAQVPGPPFTRAVALANS